MAYEGNRYAGLNRKGPEDKAGWLGAAGTVAGAGLGLLAGPGGMAAGAKLGGALGGVTHDAVNGTLTPMSVAGDVMQGVSGFKGLNGAMDNKSILEAFMRDPHSFRVPAFANGGLVTGQGMDMASQWAQMDPVQRAMLQAQQAVGPAPTAPTPQPLQQAQHPTLEALSSLLPQIMAAMPRPANPRNTKAIGAWAPAIGLAASAPAAIAQSRRASANAPIEAANTTARSDYEAKRKAYEERKTKISDTAFGNATKPFAEQTPKEEGPMVDIPGVGRVPATSGLGGDFIRKRSPGMFPESVSGQERVAKQEAEQGDIEQLASDIAAFRAEPVVSMSGRSAQFGAQVRTRVNQLLREQGSPYSWNTLATLWNEKSKFYNTQNQQRFTQLRQSAVTVRQHINQFKKFYQQYATRVGPKDIRLLSGGLFGAARQGLLGSDAAADAQALEVTANALATETAMVLSGGYAPQQVQMEEARTIVDKALGAKSTKAGMAALEGLLEARIKNAVGATPFAGGRANPYLIEASPLEGWQGEAADTAPMGTRSSGWMPKGKVVEVKGR